MKRTPTLHITLNNLQEILEQCQEITASEIIKIAHTRGFQIRNRNIIDKSTKKTKNKKVQSFEQQDITLQVELFQEKLIMLRLRKKHRNVTKIPVEHKQYSVLLETVKSALKFFKEFHYSSMEVAFIEYIEYGLDAIGTSAYYLSKLIANEEHIFRCKEFTTLVKADTNPDETEACYNAWKRVMIKNTGTYREISRQNYLYGHFVRLREVCNEHKADYDKWIDAQFDGLSTYGTNPDLFQLYTPKAVDRYFKLVKHKSKETEQEENSLDNIKSDRLKNYLKAVTGQ